MHPFINHAENSCNKLNFTFKLGISSHYVWGTIGDSVFLLYMKQTTFGNVFV